VYWLLIFNLRLVVDFEFVVGFVADGEYVVRLDVLVVLTVKNDSFCDVTSCSLLELYRRFGAYCCLLQQTT
jgi:hypothetical protein